MEVVPRSESIELGILRQWRSARYGPVSQRVYFAAGDHQADAGLYRVNAAGTDVEPVGLHSQMTAFAPAAARAVDVTFFPDYIEWPCDGNGSVQNYVYGCTATRSAWPRPQWRKLAAIDNTGWWTIRASDDGTVWLLSTSSETHTLATSNHGIVHLYAVTDNGATVDGIGAATMDGNAIGFASISGLGGGSGQGEHSGSALTPTSNSRTSLRAPSECAPGWPTG